MLHLLVLESVDVDQEKCDHRQTECHAVVRSRRPQSEDTRDVRKEDEQQQRTDVVAEFAAVLLSHVRHRCVVDEGDDRLNDCHANARLSVRIRLADHAVGEDGEHGDRNDQDQQRDVRRCDPEPVSEQFERAVSVDTDLRADVIALRRQHRKHSAYKTHYITFLGGQRSTAVTFYR